MKQILIITRITNLKNEDEFGELFPNKKTPVEQEQSGIKLSIHQGLLFFESVEEKIAKKIKDKIANEASEVLIVIHSLKFDGIKTELIKLQNNADWQIRRYSTVPENEYTKIKSAFQKVSNDPAGIEAINELFSPDWKLEARLELLQKIVAGETRGEEDDKDYFFELDSKIAEYQGNFQDFTEHDKDFFAIIQREDENAFNQYKAAYDKLYDALEIEI